MLFLFSFVIALAVTMLLLPPLIRAAPRLGFIDAPGPRKVHATNTPRIGGVAIVAGAVLATLLCNAQHEPWVTVLAVAIIVAFGAWDDRADINYRLKFLGQVLAALFIILAGDVVIEHVPFIEGSLPPAVGVPLTLLVLLATTNAVNLSDGLDGLAGGTMLLSFGAIALLAHMSGDTNVAITAVAVMGSILGFLRFNTHPARVFMGDSGSQSLGFIAGVLAIMLTQGGQPSFSSVLPVYLIGVPILDTMVVIFQRLRDGRSPFSSDKNHIHHKLMQRGFSDYEAVLLIYFGHAGIVASAYLLRGASDQVLLLLYASICAALVVVLMWPSKVAASFNRETIVDLGSTRLHTLHSHDDDARLGKWLSYYILASVLGYILIAALMSQKVSREMGLTALGFGIALIGMYVGRQRRPFHMLDRAALYVASAYAVYLAQEPIGLLRWWSICDNVFFALLALAVALAVTTSRKDRFPLTTLDFLVLSMALAVPFLPDEYFQSLHQRLALVKLIVLFYSVEMILHRYKWAINPTRLVSLTTFVAVAVRGLL